MQVLGDDDSRTLGRYRLLAELGRGGMGRVYLAAGPDGRPGTPTRVDTTGSPR